jgi:hypothetical protein
LLGWINPPFMVNTPSHLLVGGGFFVYSSKLNYMNTIINYMIDFLFGVRVEGEPANYPQSGPSEMRGVDERFFEWCREYNVGCRSKNTSVFY